MEITELLRHFGKVKPRGRNSWQASCPAHEDKSPSLTITETEDKFLLHCHAGCNVKDILDRAGLTFKDLHKTDYRTPVASWQRNLENRYDYVDETGKYVASKLRYKDKKFLWGTIKGNECEFKQPENVPLYNLPDLVKHRDSMVGQPVYFVEGEKDAQTLKSIGLTAVTSGAAKSWDKRFAKEFTGLKVVILRDNDKAGEDMARAVIEDIRDLAAAYKVLITSEEPKGDVTDYLRREHHTVADLMQLVEEERWIVKGKKQVEPLETMSFEDLLNKELPPVRWIVEGLISEGLTFISAPPKTGKSWLCLDLATSVARGESILGFNTNQCKTVYFALDDMMSRFKERLTMYLGNRTVPKGTTYVSKCRMYGDGFMEQLDNLDPDVGLIIIDTFAMIKPAQRKTQDAYTIEYHMLAELRDFAEKRHLAIVLVHHNRKDVYATKDSDPFDCMLGSTALQGVADNMIVIKKNRKKSLADDVVMFTTSKGAEEQELAIQLSRKTWRWLNLGDKESYDNNRLRQEYDRSPTIKVIKEMTLQGTYETTMGQLRNLVMERERQTEGTSEKNLGSIIAEFDDFLFEDGIDHVTPKKQKTINGKTGTYHIFKKIN